MILLGWRDAWANRSAWSVLAVVLGLGMALIADGFLAANTPGLSANQAATAKQGAEYVTVIASCVVIGVTIHLQALLVQDRRDVYRLWTQAGASRFRACLTITAQGVGCTALAIPVGAVLSTATAPVVARSLGIRDVPGVGGVEMWRSLGLASLLVVVGTGMGTILTGISATRETGLAGPAHATRRRRAVLVLRIGMTIFAAPLVAVVGAAIVTTVHTGGHSPMFTEGNDASGGGSVLPTLTLTMLVALIAVLAASLLARRVVAGLITALGARGGDRPLWFLLGWRAGAEDAATSTGASGPVLLGCGFVGVILGFVDVANAYARAAGIPGGLDRREALVLLVPTVAVSLVGHGATLVVLARRRVRAARVLRAAGARNGELMAAAAVSGAVVAWGALAVGITLIVMTDGLFAMIITSAGGAVDLTIAQSARAVFLFSLAATLCSSVGAVAGVWVSLRGDEGGLDGGE